MQLLLEIGTEELPPGEIDDAIHALARELRSRCNEQRLELGTIEKFSTPRRLALRIHNISETAEDLEERQRGPSVDIAYDDDGAPSRAAIGFAKGKGVGVDDLERVETDKGEYIFALVREQGRPATEILAKAIPAAIASIPWKRSMRWGWGDISFARPIKWIVALADDHVIPFEFAGHQAGRMTEGHRFLSDGSFSLSSPDSYVQALAEAYVIVDADKRASTIRQGLQKAAEDQQLTGIIDEELIAEVVQLVEWPVPLVGSFDEELLSVPREVLITSMKKHQRYFAFEDGSGQLANRFCFIANIKTEQPDIIVAGNERVLTARLEDARFFWDEDRTRTLESRREDLASIRYIDGIGSIADRCDRMRVIGQWLAKKLVIDDSGEVDAITRAAELSKTDLATHMVREFGNLQGTMGRYYALEDEEPQAVAQAIEEHYKPRGADDSVASDRVSAIVGLADKVDAIVGCFSLDLIPSGSADPYGLRRAAIGILRTLIHFDFELSLPQLVEQAYDVLPAGELQPKSPTCTQVVGFIEDRLRTLIDAPKDIVNAVVAVPTDRVASLVQRAEVLDQLRNDADFEPMAAGFKRVVNILENAESDNSQLEKAFRNGTIDVDSSLFDTSEESALYEAITQADSTFHAAMNDGNLQGAAQTLIGLKSPVDAYFDHVMVNVDDASVRHNRLALLQEIRQLFLRFADLSRIQVT